MTDIKRVRLVPKRKIRSYGGRGNLYAWLRAYHKEIEALRAVHLNLWSELAADMFADGVIEVSEGRALRDRIWKTWQRVCRDVQAAAASAKPKKTVHPSRLPASWRPPLADPPPPVAPAHSYPSTGGAVALTPRVLTPEAQAKVDRALAGMAERDRKKNGFWG